MNCIYDIVKDICIDCIFCNYKENERNEKKEKKKPKKTFLKNKYTQTDIISEINEREPGSLL